jgi:hypothetical protein
MKTLLAATDVVTALEAGNKRMALQLETEDTVLQKVMEADEVELALLALGRVRAVMEPAVPKAIEGRPVFRDVTREASVYVGRENHVSRELFVAMRHEGYGWLAFTFPKEGAQALVEALLGHIMGMSGGPLTTPKPPGIII